MPEMLNGIPEEIIPVFATSQIILALKKYRQLHYQIFGINFNTRLLPQPRSDSCIFNMTAKEFLDQNDFIFIAIPLSLPILENPSAQEVEILSNIETSTFTATLLQGSGFAGDTNTVHSFNNANQGGEASQKIWWYWNRRGQISGVAPNYGIDIDNRTIVTLQYHYNRGLNNNYANIALDTIKNGGFDELSRGSPEVSEIFEQIVFDQYFPRYSNEGLKKGGHWRFLDIQGQQNTIYLGCLPSGMDTTEDVVSYNKMIAEKIEEQLLKQSKNFGG